MFIKINKKIINLENVSNINIGLDTRVVFNFTHLIEMVRDGETKTQLDYAYWNFNTPEECNKNKQKLIKTCVDNGFIKSPIGTQNLVNLKKVSYISFDEDRNRIIFNLNASIVKSTTGLLSNDYIFWTYQTHDEYITVAEFIEGL